MSTQKNKLRVIQDYSKLSKELKEQVKLVYPEGYNDHIIYFLNAKGEEISALPFETDDKIYLLKMSKKLAIKIVDEDDDSDDDQILKSEIKEEYEEKNSDDDDDDDDDLDKDAPLDDDDDDDDDR